MINFFPEIGIHSPYYLGDSILMEVAATELAHSFKTRAKVLTRFPEVFAGHPEIVATDGRDKGAVEGVRYIQMGMEGQELLKQDDKLAALLEQAGVSPTRARAPRIYLTASESTEAREWRKLFEGPCIAVAMGSRNTFKSWAYTDKLMVHLRKKGYNVFAVGDNLTTDKAPAGVFKIVGQDLRKCLVKLSAMDAVVGPDTGILHAAGALRVPTVVVCHETTADLYSRYEECTVLTANRFQRRKIRSVSVAKASSAIERILAKRVQSPSFPAGNHAFVRMRGIGDVLMSLPALATLRNMDGDSTYTYITSPGLASLVSASGLADEVIAVEYDHATSGLPVLPAGPDYSKFDSVLNCINAVDFTGASGDVPRTELFGKLMGLDHVDYSTDWRFECPDDWRSAARRKLRKAGVKHDDRVIALQVDSKGLSRQWPKCRWVEFANRARSRKAGFKVVLLSDEKKGKVPGHCVDLRGQLTLTEYVGVIAESAALVGPDSSGIHIAGWLGIPAVGLFGSVDPRLRIQHYDSVHAIAARMKCVPCNDWANGSCERKRKNPPCMWAIKPQDILNKVTEVLSEDQSQPLWKRAFGNGRKAELRT